MTYGTLEKISASVLERFFFFVFAAAFPFYHLTNREVIASVKAGERMAQPDHCPHEVLGTPAHMISFMFS